MARTSAGVRAFGAAALLGVATFALPLPSSAQAQNFFSMLFGGLTGRSPTPPLRVPFGDGSQFPQETPRPHFSYGGGQAWCVRSCDGRYFPIVGPDNESQAKLCRNFCPAADTKLVYGGDIDDATTANGMPYSELPNAFRYRKETVAGCTCNGKDQIGLAPVQVEDDPTLRSGDIVAGPNGLVVANRTADRRGVAVRFSPVPEKLRARFRHVPVMARQ